MRGRRGVAGDPFFGLAPLVERFVHGEVRAKGVATHLISMSAPFFVESYPDDVWRFVAKQENERHLPMPAAAHSGVPPESS